MLQPQADAPAQLALTNHELDAPIASLVGTAVVGRDRSRRTVTHRLKACLLEARLDQVSQHRLRALAGEPPILVIAALGTGVAGDLDVEFGTAFGGTDNTVKGRDTGSIEFGAAGAKHDGTEIGDFCQPVLAGASAGQRGDVSGRRDR